MAASIISPGLPAPGIDDLRRAALYTGRLYVHSPGLHAIAIEFARHDGGADMFVPEQLEGAAWWRLLPPESVVGIEISLAREPSVELDRLLVTKPDRIEEIRVEQTEIRGQVSV